MVVSRVCPTVTVPNPIELGLTVTLMLPAVPDSGTGIGLAVLVALWVINTVPEYDPAEVGAKRTVTV